MKNIICKRLIGHLCALLTITIIYISLRKHFSQQNIIISNSWTLANAGNNRIPSIVHFVVGQGDRKQVQHRFTRSSSFSFINYLNILAARRQIRPKKIYVHYYEEPNTFWWNQTKQDTEIDITLIKSRIVENIFQKSGNYHVHRGDIIRLEAVMEYGGIYFDTDVLALRSFDPLLNLSDVVMTHQDDNRNTARNTVIIGKKNAIFLKRMHDAYQNFDQSCWDCHSARITGQLALRYPKEVMVLPTNTFFRSSWTEVSKLFDSKDYDFSANYASHVWNKMHSDRLSELTPDKILNGNFILARMILQAIGKETIQKLKKFFDD